MSLQHQPPHNPITDLPRPTAVSTYLDLLKLSIQAADEPLKLLMGSKVSRVRMAKEFNGFAEHEYHLFEVCLESGIYYFRIERTRGAQSQQTVEELKVSDDPELADMGNEIGLQVGAFPDPETTTTPTKLESFSAKAVGSLKPHHANDLITRVYSFDPPSPDVILHDIHPENLTWLEYILIANLVRSEDWLYSVFGSQCYLYAHLIFLFVQAKFCPGDMQNNPPSDSMIPVHISRRLSYPDPERRFIKLDQSKDGMAPGTWMKVLVTVVEVSLLEKLKSKFDDEWNDIRQNIEGWSENAIKLQELEAGLWKKQFPAPTGGPSSSSQILPRISGRAMSTLPRRLGLRTGPHTAAPPPRFNSLRVPRPLANQKWPLDRLVLGFGRLFKHK